MNQPSATPGAPLPPAAGSKTGLFVGLSIAAGLILVAAAVAAYVFLVYIPNKPENVYRRGMGSLGAGIQYLITPDFLDEVASTVYRGELTITYRDETADVDFRLGFDGEYDTAKASFNADADLDYSAEDYLGDREDFMGNLDMNAIFVNADADNAPKLYFRLNDLGLPPEYEVDIDQFLEDQGFDETLESVLGKWLLLDFQELIEAGLIDNDDLSSLDIEQEISQEESQEIILLLADNLSEYVFTAETEKMIFQMDEFLGEEDLDGQPAKKYSVAFNRTNAEAFLKSVRDDIAASAAWQKLSDNEGFGFVLLEEFSDTVISEAVEEFDESMAVEVWIDSETKTLRNIRITDNDAHGRNYGNYLEFSIRLDEAGKVSADLKTATYDIYACDRYWGYDDLYGESDENEDCPYIFEEPPADCGDRPDWDDFVLSSSRPRAYSEEAIDASYEAFSRARDAYDECIKPVVASIKASATPSIVSLGLTLDTDSNQIDYEAAYVEGNLEIRFTMTTVGRVGEVDVQLPEDYKLIFDDEFFERLDDNTNRNQQLTDLSSIRAQVNTFVGNNNGRLPDEEQMLNQVLDAAWTIYYQPGETLLDSASPSPAGGVSYETAFPESLADHFLPNHNQIHIFAGAACGRTTMSNTANQPGRDSGSRYAEGDLEEAGVRASLAFVYTLEGETESNCEDNT